MLWFGVVSCSGSESSGEGTPTGFAAQYARSFCKAQAHCCSVKASCENDLRAVLQERPLDAKTQGCLDALASATACLEGHAAIGQCLFGGSKLAGEACTDPSECRNPGGHGFAGCFDVCIEFPPAGPGEACLPKDYQGSALVRPYCGPGAECVSDVCVPGPKLGAACDIGGLPCSAGQCWEGTCQQASAGGACQLAGPNCEHGSQCDAGVCQLMPLFENLVNGPNGC